MDETLRDSAENERARFRVCHECGEALNVTYLIAKRNYACAHCGFPFQHHPALGEFEVEKGKARSAIVAMLPLMLMPFGLPYFIAWAYEIEILAERLLIIGAASTFLTFISMLWVRRLSRDPSGSVSTMMTMMGFAAISMLFVREGVETPEELAELEWRLTFTALVMIGIGAYTFSKFMRNRSTLVRVSAEGKKAPQV